MKWRTLRFQMSPIRYKEREAVRGEGAGRVIRKSVVNEDENNTTEAEKEHCRICR